MARVSRISNIKVDDQKTEQILREMKYQLDHLDSSVVTIMGSPGTQGDSYQEAFETVSKNLKSWDAVLNYTAGDLTSIVYTSGASSITKTFNYTAGDLTSIVLSGSTPSGISLTKTLSYTAGDLTGVTYS